MYCVYKTHFETHPSSPKKMHWNVGKMKTDKCFFLFVERERVVWVWVFLILLPAKTLGRDVILYAVRKQ